MKAVELLTEFASTEATLWIAEHGRTDWAESRPFACLRDAILAIDDVDLRRQFVTELLVHEPGYDRAITGDEIVELRRAVATTGR